MEKAGKSTSIQRLLLLRGKAFKFFQDVCTIIQLKEPRIELHLLGKRKGIDIAVGDIAIYGVAHTLRHMVMDLFLIGLPVKPAMTGESLRTFSVSCQAQGVCLKTHVQGSPQSRASLNTLVKYYSWRQRTD